MTNVFLKYLLKKIWYILLILGILFLLWYIREQKTQISILENNVKTVKGEFNVLKTKNGELVLSQTSLTLEKNEFKKKHGDLVKELKDMGIKLRKVETLNKVYYEQISKHEKINTVFQKVYDTVYVTGEVSDTLKLASYNFNNKTKFDEVSGVIVVPVRGLKEGGYILSDRSPYIENLHFTTTNSLTFVPVINYKRVWIFWKRPISVTVNIKSQNPSLNFTGSETFYLK